jgi:hypothetical protein
VVADHFAELISQMNVSNGSLVSSIASDDAGIAKQVAENRVLSRSESTRRDREVTRTKFSAASGNPRRPVSWAGRAGARRDPRDEQTKNFTGTFQVTRCYPLLPEETSSARESG